jgi:cytidylate kinase
VGTTLEEVRADLRRRDEQDRRRDYSVGDGRRAADPGGAIELDTTGLDLEAVVTRLVSWARERGA